MRDSIPLNDLDPDKFIVDWMDRKREQVALSKDVPIHQVSGRMFDVQSYTDPAKWYQVTATKECFICNCYDFQINSLRRFIREQETKKRFSKYQCKHIKRVIQEITKNGI